MEYEEELDDEDDEKNKNKKYKWKEIQVPEIPPENLQLLMRGGPPSAGLVRKVKKITDEFSEVRVKLVFIRAPLIHGVQEDISFLQQQEQQAPSLQLDILCSDSCVCSEPKSSRGKQWRM
eukprot:739877-Hanusia_phi.AAC.4